MYFKLSLKNVRRSLKDYTIYFLTLTFGICIFYVFNSLDSQQAMLDLTSSQRQMIKLLTTMMGYISVFISVILGFLIIYANKFLIKRRKKELGIYMTLGMNKGGISRVLLYETVSIGFISMAVGLLLGVFLSQAFSIVTANLFEVDLRSYTFAFSGSAFVKSILYFGLIFLCVMLFNWISVSKCKLIDLMTANRKNESLKVRKIWVSVVLFLVSLVLLGAAYAMIIHNGMMMLDAEFTGSLILGSVGTLLFFFSLSGFLVKVVQANKRIYLKNLNMFILRQLGSKINTTFVSMAVICIMLLVTIEPSTVWQGSDTLQQSTP
ncbi:MAG: ABC transporter permease [Oscillospiraceae bacterium]